MTVAQNVAYGLKRRSFERAALAARVSEMLRLVKLTGLDSRFPGQLSGGQQQRVALARALATGPEVLLLDEPLSALEAKLRESLRVELKEILGEAGSTTIVVTHDQEEAMSLAERVIVMDRGRIMQEGAPKEIYGRPAHRLVAEFIGRANWFRGRLQAGPPHELRRFTRNNGLDLRVAAASEPPGEYELCVRPERMQVQLDSAASPVGNSVRGKIIDTAVVGPDVHLYVALDSGERIAVTRKNTGEPSEQAGVEVCVTFAPADCALFAIESPT